MKISINDLTQTLTAFEQIAIGKPQKDDIQAKINSLKTKCQVPPPQGDDAERNVKPAADKVVQHVAMVRLNADETETYQKLLRTVIAHEDQELAHYVAELQESQAPQEVPLPQNASLRLQKRCELVKTALDRHDTTIPFRRKSPDILEPLLDQRISKIFGADTLDTVKAELLTQRIISVQKPRSNYRTINHREMEQYISTHSNPIWRTQLRSLMNEFEFDSNPEASDAESWEHHHEEKGVQHEWNWRSDAAIALHSDPAYGRTTWWGESGNVSDAFATRYGFGPEPISVRRLPYALLRDVLFAVKDLVQFLTLTPERFNAFQQYTSDPSLHHFQEMWKSGVTAAFLTSFFDTAFRLIVINPLASQAIKDALQHPDSYHIFAALKKWPGIFAGAAIVLTWAVVEGGRFLIFNPEAMQQYKNMIDDSSWKNLKALILKNPGFIGGLLMSGQYVIESLFKALIWNPEANVKQYLVPSKKEDDTVLNSFHIFKENPGLLFAVAALATKWLLFNPCATEAYGTYMASQTFDDFKALWNAKPGLIGGAIMTLEFALSLGLRSLIYNPLAREDVPGVVPISEATSVQQTLQVFKTNPGFLFATVAIVAKYLGFNPAASKEYGDYLLSQNIKDLGALWQKNPGLIGGALMSLEFALSLGLRSLIWNPLAEEGVWEHLSPTTQADSMTNTFKVFSKNPGFLFASLVIIFKYMGFNWMAIPQYAKFAGTMKWNDWKELCEASPGLIAGAIITLQVALNCGFRRLIWNPTPEKTDNFTSISEAKSVEETFRVFETNPGWLFACCGILAKYVGYNPAATPAYAKYLRSQSWDDFKELWEQAPGLFGGAIMTLEFALSLGLRSLIWNPLPQGSIEEVQEGLLPSTSKEDSMKKTFAVFTKNPGFLYAAAIVAFKYIGVNLSAHTEYLRYAKSQTWDDFKEFWEANPGLIGGIFMTLEFGLSLGLRTLIYNPLPKPVEGFSSISQAKTFEETLKVFKTNPGLLYAVLGIAAKYLGYNPVASGAYATYLHSQKAADLKALWEKTPGLLGGLVMTLEFGLSLGLRGLIYNPLAEPGVMENLSPARTEDESMKNTFAVFKKNPGFLFAMGIIAVKYIGFNWVVSERYGNFMKEQTWDAYKALWEYNPGLIGGLLMFVEFGLSLGLRTLIYNPIPAPVEGFNSISESQTFEQTWKVWGTNPGIVFASLGIMGKYLGLNPAAFPAYGTYLHSPTLENFKTLWQANPGLVGGILITLGFAFPIGFIYNPYAEKVVETIFPATSAEDSFAKTLSVFEKNPGLIFATVAILTKYFLFNPSTSQDYADYWRSQSIKDLGKLWEKNPGLLLGAVMTIEFVLSLGLRTLIYNPFAENLQENLAPPLEQDKVFNTLAVFKKNPGIIFASAMILGKYFLFNPSANPAYANYMRQSSPSNLAALWEANPGLLMGALTSLGFVLEWGGRSLVWNPAFAAKDFMFAKDADLSRIELGLDEVGRLSAKWPGLIYGIVLIIAKYGFLNFSAAEEYLNAFKAVGGAEEIGTLFKKNPGAAGFTIFIIIKFFEELGAKVLIDPRLSKHYHDFWDNPNMDTAADLFQSGVLGAALFAIGRGIEWSWVQSRGRLAGLLERQQYQP